MTGKTYEMNPVEAITAGAVGEPGHREFYIQARTPEASVTLLAEKVQVLLLAQGVYQLLAQIEERHAAEPPPLLIEAADLGLRLPLQPDFRVASMELAYHSSTDLVELVAHELIEEEPETEGLPEAGSPSVARLHATRAQMRAMADHAVEVAARGRPLCPFCGQPDEAQGHVCPKRNGHRPAPGIS